MKCLVLACGNPLRSDDGIGLELARYAREWIRDWEAIAVVITATQWTPEMAAEIASAESVIFLDCCTDNAPGKIALRVVEPGDRVQPSTHHLHASELLALSRDLYDTLPVRAFLLTIGAKRFALGEGFSDTVADALPAAKDKLKEVLKVCLAR
jgi:hydrogenase maturation protease